jgi:geranylgeranylglycerol-phosphate geranylgeranyltransferase
MSKLKGLFSLIRFELPLAAAICVILGQLFALGYFAPLILTISAALSVFFISASILVSNDYFDIETDKINAPHRPIPSGLVSPAQALALALFLLLSGLILSLTISIAAFLFSMGLTIIGLLYNRKFKKHGLLGNLMVSFSVGMTFVFGGLSVGMPFNKVVLFFAVIAALVDLGEEIAADSMDVKGDKLINSKSIAIRHGKEKALRVSAFIFVFVIVLSIIPFLLEWFNAVYLIPIIVMDIFIGYSTFRLVRSKDEEGRKYIRLLYLGATFGLLVFLIMRMMGF